MPNGSPTNLKDYGAKYVQIDDGWQGAGGRDGQRDWTTVNPQQFPGGMAKLAADIKSLGLEPGLWLAPHGQSNPQFVSNHPSRFSAEAGWHAPLPNLGRQISG